MKAAKQDPPVRLRNRTPKPNVKRPTPAGSLNAMVSSAIEQAIRIQLPVDVTRLVDARLAERNRQGTDQVVFPSKDLGVDKHADDYEVVDEGIPISAFRVQLNDLNGDLTAYLNTIVITLRDAGFAVDTGAPSKPLVGGLTQEIQSHINELRRLVVLTGQCAHRLQGAVHDVRQQPAQGSASSR